MAAPLNCGMAIMVNAVGTIPKSHFGTAVIHVSRFLFVCQGVHKSGSEIFWLGVLKTIVAILVVILGDIIYSSYLTTNSSRKCIIVEHLLTIFHH